MEIETLARSVGVDPKTVHRWLKGRLPHPRHRWKASDALGRSEEELWPEASAASASGSLVTSEIVSAYVRRADAPSQLWSRLLDRAGTTIDLMGCSSPSSTPTCPASSPTSAPKACASASPWRTRSAPRSPPATSWRTSAGRSRDASGQPSATSSPCCLILGSSCGSTGCRCTMRSTGSMIRCSSRRTCTSCTASSTPCST